MKAQCDILSSVLKEQASASGQVSVGAHMNHISAIRLCRIEDNTFGSAGINMFQDSSI